MLRRTEGIEWGVAAAMSGVCVGRLRVVRRASAAAWRALQVGSMGSSAVPSDATRPSWMGARGGWEVGGKVGGVPSAEERQAGVGGGWKGGWEVDGV